MKRNKLMLSKTVAHYKIINFIYDNFNYDAIESEKIKIHLIDEHTIRISDQKGDSMKLYYDEKNRKVIIED